MSEQEHTHPPQEPDVLSWKSITVVTVGTIALSILLSVLASVAVRHYRAHPPDLDVPPRFPTNAAVEHRLFEGEGEGEQRRAAERAQLDSWGWIDRDAEIVRIPIDESIELVAEDQP